MTLAEKEARQAGKQFIKRQRRAAAAALEAYAAQTDPEMRVASINTQITHLLTALHHLADHKEIAWKEILHEAQDYYCEDRNDARGPKADAASAESTSPPLPAVAPRYYGVPDADGVTQTIHEVVLHPIPPPAPGLHPAPYDGPRRADVIRWVRDYLIVSLNQADVPPDIRPSVTTIDGWAAVIVDHLVRGQIDRLPPTPPPAESPIQPLRWQRDDRVRIDHPGTSYHGDEGRIVAVTNNAVKVWILGRRDHWFDPAELRFIEGRQVTPDKDGDESA